MLASIHRASVFLLFDRRPGISLKKSNICREVVKKTLELSKKRVMSSAYWLIFISCPSIVIPLIFLFFLIVSANISTQRIKRYGEKGQPCLTPLSSLKKPLDQPLFWMQLSVLWYKKLNPTDSRWAKIEKLQGFMQEIPLFCVKNVEKKQKTRNVFCGRIYFI